MTRANRPHKQREAAPKGALKKPHSVRFVTVMAFVLPGSGQVFNGAPYRGVIMQFGMVFGAFVTYMLTTPDISPVGRMAGGLLVYVFSIVDANGIAKLRVKAWERIEAGEPPRPRRGMTREAAIEGRSGGTKSGAASAVHKKGVRRASAKTQMPGKARTVANAAAEPEEVAKEPSQAESATRTESTLPNAGRSEAGGPSRSLAAVPRGDDGRDVIIS